jgi:hypothetical protein
MLNCDTEVSFCEEFKCQWGTGQWGSCKDTEQQEDHCKDDGIVVKACETNAWRADDDAYQRYL